MSLPDLLPVVVVQSATSVLVNGVDYGQPIDALRNNPALTAPIQRALIEWEARRDQMHAAEKARLNDTIKRNADAHAAKISEMGDERAAAEQSLKMDHAKELQSTHAEIAEARALVTALRKHADQLPPEVSAVFAAFELGAEGRELAQIEARRNELRKRRAVRARA